jgi:hypothetical protein
MIGQQATLVSLNARIVKEDGRSTGHAGFLIRSITIIIIIILLIRTGINGRHFFLQELDTSMQILKASPDQLDIVRGQMSSLATVIASFELQQEFSTC